MVRLCVEVSRYIETILKGVDKCYMRADPEEFEVDPTPEKWMSSRRKLQKSKKIVSS